MSRFPVERRLAELSEQAKGLRADLAVTEQQLAQLDGEVEDARLQSLVADNRLAAREERDARRHADAMRRHRQELIDELQRIERTQDELLDRLLER